MHLPLLEEGSLPCLALLFILGAIGARAVFRFLREEPEPTTSDVIDRGDSSVTHIKLHTFKQPASAQTACSLSPFCEKLELFLRMSALDFKAIDGNVVTAPKGKLPLIEHGENLVPDSELAIRYLINTFGGNKTHLGRIRIKLTPEEQARSVLLTNLTNDSLYQLLLHARWVDLSVWNVLKGLYFGDLPLLFRLLIVPSFRRSVVEWLWGHGYSRYSQKDRVWLARREIDALATILGDHPYFNGDEPTPVDAAVFGILDNVIYGIGSVYGIRDHVQTKKNLVAFVEGIRQEFF
jgi:glutathione S-transferase